MEMKLFECWRGPHFLFKKMGLSCMNSRIERKHLTTKGGRNDEK
jgi:hypothetical protein